MKLSFEKFVNDHLNNIILNLNDKPPIFYIKLSEPITIGNNEVITLIDLYVDQVREIIDLFDDNDIQLSVYTAITSKFLTVDGSLEDISDLNLENVLFLVPISEKSKKYVNDILADRLLTMNLK